MQPEEVPLFNGPFDENPRRTALSVWKQAVEEGKQDRCEAAEEPGGTDTVLHADMAHFHRHMQSTMDKDLVDIADHRWTDLPQDAVVRTAPVPKVIKPNGNRSQFERDRHAREFLFF